MAVLSIAALLVIGLFLLMLAALVVLVIWLVRRKKDQRGFPVEMGGDTERKG